MISCQYIPENKTTLDFIVEKAKEVDCYENKVCLIVPTERNLRYLACCGFKYVDIFSLSNFYNIGTKYDSILLPKELRPYYLLKALKKLNKDEINAIFKTDNEEFLNSFLSFIQNAKNIFTFYRELFAENVTVKELSKVALYSDYELQITILNKLWDIYIYLIHKDNYMDKWETYNNIILNDMFIENYNEYIFLINGFLTKYELNFIKNISLKKNVTVVFNYEGNLYAHHKEYEKFFNTSALKDKQMPILNNSNTQIYECISNISQIELITKKAFEINKKHNIPLSKMVVILPDTNCKPYFIRLDVYKIFDVSSGEDVINTRIYTLLENILKIYEELINYNMVHINSVLNLFADSFLLSIEEIKQTTNQLKDMLNQNKLYIEKDYFLKIPFIQKYCYEYFNVDEKTTINNTLNLYKSFLIPFKEILLYESTVIHNVIILIDKLSTIYKNIPDIVDFIEASRLIISEIATQTIDLPKREIAVTGILETRNMNYDVVFMPYMTEELFPPKSSKDLFINTEIRNQLNLPTYIDRENLMKNYCFQVINHAKITIFSYSDKHSSICRSSFIEELIVQNNLKVEYFAPKEISLLKTAIYHYNDTNTNITIKKTDDMLENLKNFTYSASALNIYKTCSLKFYFKYVLNIDKQAESIDTLDNQIFGTVIHNVFKELYNKGVNILDKLYLEEFKILFLKTIKHYDAYKYNKVERFITDIIYTNIEKIVNAEQTHAREGFTILSREKCIKANLNGFNLIGYPDKIEIKDNNIYITDYKYKDIKEIKPINDDNFENKDDIQLPIYAILIEKEMKKLPKDIFYFSIKEDFQYFSGFNMQYYEDYKKHILLMLESIISKEEYFIQTMNTRHCNFCSYNKICGRNNGFFAK